jgi:hypothetical protein
MRLATVHWLGAAVAYCALAVAAVVLWWDRSGAAGLAAAVALVGLALGDLVRIWLTGTWPRVCAREVSVELSSRIVVSLRSSQGVTRYRQIVEYIHDGSRRQSALVWGRNPPACMTVRVNPSAPTELLCLALVGRTWVVCLSSAAAIGVHEYIGATFAPSRALDLLVLGGVTGLLSLVLWSVSSKADEYSSNRA